MAFRWQLTAPKPISRTVRSRLPKLTEAWFRLLFAEERLRTYGIVRVPAETDAALQSCYVGPLLALLERYARSGDVRIRSVYRDELLRYAPQRAAPEVRLQYFRELIPQLEAAILEEVPSAADRARATEELAAVHAPLLATPEKKRLTMLSFGDCLMYELRVFLLERSREACIPLDMRSYYFSSRQGKGISTDSVLDAIERDKADLVAFSFFSYEGLPVYPALLRDAEKLSETDIAERVTQIMTQVRAFVNEVRAKTDIPFLIHNASGLPLSRYRRRLPLLPPLSPARRRTVAALNQAIEELVAHTENCLLVDEQSLVRRHGLRACSRSVVPGRAKHAYFHTQAFGDFAAGHYLAKLRAFHTLRRTKVLAVDFDHTLWRGVMAEGPVEHLRPRQELLRRLREAGILLVAVSKNDPGSIRWAEMHLQPEDFALLQISWRPKAEAIEQAAQLLDLGLDSFVLIDDNPAERHLVAQQLPTVQVLDALDADSWQALEWLLAFPNTRQTAEAKQRTALYREQVRRREAMTEPVDYNAMMQSLHLRVQFGPAMAGDLDRLCELVQRTNQFNTTTIRYSKAQLQEMMASPRHGIYVAHLADRFGKQGLVLAVVVSRQGDVCTFESFVMSCRAMGFELERLALALTIEAEEDAHTFVGRFVPTERNNPAAELYSAHGFVTAGPEEWILGPGAERPQAPDWFEVQLLQAA